MALGVETGEEFRALQKELASTKDALELFRLVERHYRQSQDKQARALADVNKRLEAARAEVEEALFAKDRGGEREKEEWEIERKEEEKKKKSRRKTNNHDPIRPSRHKQ